MSKLRRRAALAAGLLALFAALVFLRLRLFTLGDLETFLGAPLPAGAADVQMATRTPFGRIVWLRFTLPPDGDASAYAAVLGLDAPLRAGFTPFPAPNYTEADLTWWTPYEAAAFSGLYAIHDDRVYELLADQSDPARLVIYLRVYEL